MFSKVLIANRGEIARRIARTAKSMGIKVVAVYSEADAEAPFVKEADEAICIGPPAPKESYLNIGAIMKAAADTKAEAIHPGYGFLSESSELVKACDEAGLAFVGPGLTAIEAMGSKVRAKQAMRAADVPVVPGSEGAVPDVDTAVAMAEEIGFPVMLKASAGGGGIGMVKCKSEKKLRKSFEDAQKKGEMFFGSSELLLEKCIENPHHVEVQVFGDKAGNIIHLFDRECSVQRRNQKILEEAPSPFVKDDVRQKICAAAVRAAETVGYENAGTVEFVMDGEGQFYFLEMNTRLQVEHPVTESILGLDLVEWQFRIAAGEDLPKTQDEIQTCGHAIELRLCAEDPARRFFPSPGTISKAKWPSGPGIRVDSAVESGSEITPYYDSMFAKLVGFGETREQAISILESALDNLQIEGITHNGDLHRTILGDSVFRGGNYNTGYLEEVHGLKS
jgi:acetyl-CoA carboxylase, biotin carboxylase subunit